ncbi:MAG: AAA family ATPase [Bacteroidales bacterium]|nr:AAA family ATPase [Bacteroidales bacterium]
MVYDRQTHFDFLESELKAQTNNYIKKLNASAQQLLLNDGEMFVARFLALREGVMILEFSTNRALPRIGDFLYCMLLPKELRDYRNWGELTFGDLVKRKGYFSEINCIWHSKSDNDGYSIVGFRGVDEDFAGVIAGAVGVILVMGPNKPPYEYIENLQKVVMSHTGDFCPILDDDYIPNKWSPTPLDNKKSISTFIASQLDLTPTIILQGPPGTGKTYMIAELCSDLCARGNSVLVTALTNRALMEIVGKKPVEGMLKAGKIFKTNLSYDEQQEQKNLGKAKELSPMKGCLMLSTYYITSGYGEVAVPIFDYVIMDEASQALLAMFEVTRRLGKHNLWIGDVKQLPPVVEINDDKINGKGLRMLVEGLNTLTECSGVPIYQLTETFRLPPRAAEFTKVFYRGGYHARNGMESFGLETAVWAKYLHPDGGPTLIKTELPVGEKAPVAALKIASELVSDFYRTNKDIKVAVLSLMVETVKNLQREIVKKSGGHKSLIVETVARVQGLTTDVTVFVIPETSVSRSLETRLFNVATSRARGYTIIIADKGILQRQMSPEVRDYLEKLDSEFSFYLPYHKQVNLLEAE